MAIENIIFVEASPTADLYRYAKILADRISIGRPIMYEIFSRPARSSSVVIVLASRFDDFSRPALIGAFHRFMDAHGHKEAEITENMIANHDASFRPLSKIGHYNNANPVLK